MTILNFSKTNFIEDLLGFLSEIVFKWYIRRFEKGETIIAAGPMDV